MINKIYDNIKKFIVDNIVFLIVFIIIIMAFYIELPYVIYKSGGTVDMNNRITTDLKDNKNGSINMTYVTVLKGTPAFILASYILPDWDLVSMKEEFRGEDYDKVIEEGKVDLNDGIDYAIISAFNESNYNIHINKKYLKVMRTSEDSKNDLKYGDEIISINNKNMYSFDDISSYLSKQKENDTINIKVVNDGKKYNRTAALYNTEDGLKMGVIIRELYDYNTEIPISIKVEKNESGASGGLMTALCIYDKLNSKDITKGHKIAGTGTITSEGLIGPIGGVKYKMLAAEKKRADTFFVPLENYKEAVKIKNKRKLNIKVVKVEKLKDAINYLEGLKTIN